MLKEEGEVTPMYPPVQIIVLLHLRVGGTLYVIPKRASRELEGPKICCLLSKQ